MGSEVFQRMDMNWDHEPGSEGEGGPPEGGTPNVGNASMYVWSSRFSRFMASENL